MVIRVILIEWSDGSVISADFRTASPLCDSLLGSGVPPHCPAVPIGSSYTWWYPQTYQTAPQRYPSVVPTPGGIPRQIAFSLTIETWERLLIRRRMIQGAWTVLVWKCSSILSPFATSQLVGQSVGQWFSQHSLSVSLNLEVAFLLYLEINTWRNLMVLQ